MEFSLFVFYNMFTDKHRNFVAKILYFSQMIKKGNPSRSAVRFRLELTHGKLLYFLITLEINIGQGGVSLQRGHENCRYNV